MSKTKAGNERKRPARMNEGRPTKYNDELADQICALIAEGNSLPRISKKLGFDLVSFYSWLRKYDEFLKKYTQAKEDQADTMAEQMLDISDSELPRDVFGKIDSAAVNQARLRVDTRKWIAARLKPKKFGDSTTLRGDSEAPLNPSVNVILNK